MDPNRIDSAIGDYSTNYEQHPLLSPLASDPSYLERRAPWLAPSTPHRAPSSDEDMEWTEYSDEDYFENIARQMDERARQLVTYPDIRWALIPSSEDRGRVRQQLRNPMRTNLAEVEELLKGPCDAALDVSYQIYATLRFISGRAQQMSELGPQNIRRIRLVIELLVRELNEMWSMFGIEKLSS